MTMVEKARVFATAVHAGQLDKAGKPYIDHPFTVAEKVAPYGELYEVVALLHDTVEDTPVTLKQIAEEFGIEVAEAVLSVTRLDPKYADRLGFPVFEKETRRAFVERAYKHPVGRIVKKADTAHNMDPVRHAALPDSEKGIIHAYRKAMYYLDHGEWPEGHRER